MPMREDSQVGWPVISAARKPSGMPGRLMRSGIIWWSISMKVITTSAAPRTSITGSSGERPKRRKRRRKRKPFRASTSG
jgi:hypothetical protein